MFTRKSVKSTLSFRGAASAFLTLLCVRITCAACVNANSQAHPPQHGAQPSSHCFLCAAGLSTRDLLHTVVTVSLSSALTHQTDRHVWTTQTLLRIFHDRNQEHGTRVERRFVLYVSPKAIGNTTAPGVILLLLLFFFFHKIDDQSKE